MSLDSLRNSISYVNGITPLQVDLLREELDISSFEDLLHLFPNRYIDRTKYWKIDEIYNSKSEVQIIGQIINLRQVSQKKGSRLEATFVDDTGEIQLVWFRMPQWLLSSIKVREHYVIFGRCRSFKGTFQMSHPEMELLSKHQLQVKNAIQPVYPSTKKLEKNKIYSRIIAKFIASIFSHLQGDFAETLSKPIISELQLMSKDEALIQIHFPSSQKNIAQSELRLKFEELFFVQLRLLKKNIDRKEKIKGFLFKKIGHLFHDFYNNHLPFSLTNAQKKVLKEIRKDLGSGIQMNRLLQGDVGSGKTIVALFTALMALDNGYQVGLITPTEVLSNQHFESFEALLKNSSIKVGLLTGSTKSLERKKVLEQLQNDELNILIGTHALLEDRVIFSKLGLAIIDEQHRFGVAQRSKLWLKNTQPPHILIMTATPIPRTLAMSLYGDLDISTIGELPPDRKPVKTLHKYYKSRLEVFKFMRDQIALGKQIYIVYPLIEESETLSYNNLMEGYTSLDREFPKPKYQISIVHGQMKSEDKTFEMNRFKRNETQIMLATTVIEVGVDIPNASVMIIESAERFGLSQLHQLRGRVGRGSEQSYCILMTDYQLSKDSITRIEAMVRSNDGFEIAEVDLKLRGPGDIMGTKQSGILNLKIADISKDHKILQIARNYALNILKEDPHLESLENKPIKETLYQLEKNKTIWKLIG